MNEVIQHNWLAHLNNELLGTNRVRIISPFITDNIVRHLLETFEGDEIQVITRYSLNDFRSRVSSLAALRRLVDAGAMIKSVKKTTQ